MSDCQKDSCCGSKAPRALPGTGPLTLEGDLAEQMVAGLRRYLLGQIAQSVQTREELWQRDFSSNEAYVQSVTPNRDRLGRYLGTDPEEFWQVSLSYTSAPEQPAMVAQGDAYDVYSVRWTVLDGIDGEGLLLQPHDAPAASVVAIPDADWTPEMAVGLAGALPPEAQFARRLAEQGCQVLVPMLVDRSSTWSGNPHILGASTAQPHREWIYRQAYEMGKHIIGYEAGKVIAAITWLFGNNSGNTKLGVMGYGEGGLVAFYAAALDRRIDSTLVSGYFREREEIWKEPIYRNVWAILQEFGDAGIASLIAPRTFTVEACRGPVVFHTGCTPGEIIPPPIGSVRAEFDKVQSVYDRLDSGSAATLVGDGEGNPGTDAALSAFLTGLGCTRALNPPGPAPVDQRKAFDHRPRLKRQIDAMTQYTQKLMRLSPYVRERFWANADLSSVAAYEKSIEPYREKFDKEFVGALPPPSLPPNARTRIAYDEPNWLGYEVVLDVWPGVFAYGVLLVPKNLQDGEQRPVVVCQHGLEGRPQDCVDPKIDSCYHAFAGKLADRGFIVFAPQNPYIGLDGFRVLQRMAQPIKCTLFSMIVRQHQVILDWMAGLPFADAGRMAFYGLSYGGKTAMRVPPLATRYCLSICSADFNEWLYKNITVDAGLSYMYSGEYDMYEFNLGQTFNYAEMAALIAPRPFMVERGHDDGVAHDEWVAWEFARVRRLYAKLGIPDRAEIEFFNGPHEINGAGTFRFLHKHLNWPEPAQ